ncbi:MAG: hypothetical protein GMKNLPBB_00464 [Myxococcota bacterium]|nr:hypothetical protein [Myxococcota bacterium]
MIELQHGRYEGTILDDDEQYDVVVFLRGKEGAKEVSEVAFDFSVDDETDLVAHLRGGTDNSFSGEYEYKGFPGEKHPCSLELYAWKNRIALIGTWQEEGHEGRWVITASLSKKTA